VRGVLCREERASVADAGIYFRALLIGYSRASGRSAALPGGWRLAGPAAFRGIALDEYTPDHSTISRTRRLIDLDTHREVFGWVLACWPIVGC